MEKEIVLSQPSGDALQALVDSFAENTQQVQERLSSAMESLMGKNNNTNLNLTYAVRDGIISHCGEVNQNAIKPRDEAISLDQYKTVNHYNPYTWEGCVVKYADKISIYKLLISSYDGLDTPNRIQSMALIYPDIFPLFADWITLRWDLGGHEKRNNLRVVYNISSGIDEYKRAVLDYIAGMTDNYAKRIYGSICSFI